MPKPIVQRLLCSALLGAAFAAAAQDYPAKPIRMIIASYPGSGVDTVGRLVASRMSEALNVQMIVDNRAGGGTIESHQSRGRSARTIRGVQ
jgi:tripartite-type tricarboxylate transporter receptor subunit TctC